MQRLRIIFPTIEKIRAIRLQYIIFLIIHRELLKEKIFNPLQMINTGSEDDELIVDKKAYGYLKSGRTFQVDPYMFMPNAMGAGHMYSTVEDMLLWDRAL